jgi:isopentenyl phosphate kinase
VASLERAGALPFSLPPSAWLVTASGRPTRATCEPLLLALAGGLLPVVHGDVVLDRRQGVAIAATETVLVAVAGALRRAGEEVAAAVWLGDTDGLLDEAGTTVRRLDAARWRELAGAVGGSRGVDVTGGMRLRVETALALARRGVRSVIANGTRPGALAAALAGGDAAATEVPARG